MAESKPRPSDDVSITSSLRLRAANIRRSVEADPSLRLPTTCYIGGAAWGCVFYVGAYEAMWDCFGKERLQTMSFLGDSAGALLALGMALSRPPSALDELYTTLATKGAARGVVGRMSTYHQEAMEALLFRSNDDDDDDDAETGGDALDSLNESGRFGCGVTTASFASCGEHHFVTSFASLQVLFDSLHGSMHIPFYCAFDVHRPCIARVGGRRVVDGAYAMAGSSFPFPRDTLSVYVAPGPAVDVACDPALSPKECLYPFTGARFHEVRRLGYEAMLRWAEGAIAQSTEQQSSAAAGGGVLCVASAEEGKTAAAATTALATIPKVGPNGEQLWAPDWPMLYAFWPLRMAEELVWWIQAGRQKATAVAKRHPMGVVSLVLAFALQLRRTRWVQDFVARGRGGFKTRGRKTALAVVVLLTVWGRWGTGFGRGTVRGSLGAWVGSHARTIGWQGQKAEEEEA